MGVTAASGLRECPTCGPPVTGSPIHASVGAGGVNAQADVKKVQQLLNALPPEDGGPSPLLKEDGIKGPKTQSAISRYQAKIMPSPDGRIDAGGRTITTLCTHICTSPAVPYGKLGAPQGPMDGGGEPNPQVTEGGLDGPGCIAAAKACLRELEPSLATLRWKMTLMTPAMERLMNKHFAFGGATVDNADMALVQSILADTHFYVSRFGLTGSQPVDNIMLYSDAQHEKVLAFTVRGGNKMSTNEIQIYENQQDHCLTKCPGQSIWLTRLFGQQQGYEKHWTILHEMAHFVGGRDGTVHQIDDLGYSHDSNFGSLTKWQRLHNAESLSLFFLECCIGTERVLQLHDMKVWVTRYASLPHVSESGQLIDGPGQTKAPTKTSW